MSVFIFINIADVNPSWIIVVSKLPYYLIVIKVISYVLKHLGV